MISLAQKRIIFLATALVSGGVGWIILLLGQGWIRNYVGDGVFILFLYALLGITFPGLYPKKKAIGIFLLALAIEIFQSLHLIDHSPTADALIGSTFDPIDIATYATSAFLCCFIEQESRLPR